MAHSVKGAPPVIPRDDWFDRLARRSVGREITSSSRGSITRRDVVGVFAGTTALAFFGSLLKPARASGSLANRAKDEGCAGTRSFYVEGCSKPIPKLNYTPKENGCGPQNGFNPVPQAPLNMANFKTACDEHDRGYGTCNRPKAVTDQRFLNDMKLICIQEYPVSGLASAMSLVQCTRNAEIYYSAVSNLGDDPYKDGQSEGCDCCNECPGDQQKCGGECCRKGFVCGEKDKCCEDCAPGWKKCPMGLGNCGWGCCMPDLSLCCPGTHPGYIRCCSPKGKCYKGGCAA